LSVFANGDGGLLTYSTMIQPVWCCLVVCAPWSLRIVLAVSPVSKDFNYFILC